MPENLPTKKSFLKNVKAWQIGVAVLLGTAILLLLNHIINGGGFLKTTVNRTADGIGWIMDEVSTGISTVYHDFQDWDWTWWD